MFPTEKEKKKLTSITQHMSLPQLLDYRLHELHQRQASLKETSDAWKKRLEAAQQKDT